MKSHVKSFMLLSIVQVTLAAPVSADGQWFINPGSRGNLQNPAMGNGFRGVTPNGLVGANVGGAGPAGFGGAPPIGTPQNGGGTGPAGSGGAPPIGTTQGGVGSINNGTGGVATNGTLNGALGTNAIGDGLYSDGLLYSGGYGAGGYGGNQFTQDPVSSYATAYYSGMANLLRSQGQYEVEDSQATINRERARTRYIDNQQTLFYARQAAKRLGLAAHMEDREVHKANRARQEEFLASHRPQSLSHEQLDPWNGTIQWPAALMTSEFDELRNSLAELFGQKARGYEKSMVASKIDKNVQEMRDLLRSEILTIPLHDYSEARKFLDSMAVSVH